MAVAAPGSIVFLADPGPIEGGPLPGDVLETRTGRRYLILEAARSGKAGARWRCSIMGPDEEAPEGSVLFLWARPRSKARSSSRSC